MLKYEARSGRYKVTNLAGQRPAKFSPRPAEILSARQGRLRNPKSAALRTGEFHSFCILLFGCRPVDWGILDISHFLYDAYFTSAYTPVNNLNKKCLCLLITHLYLFYCQVDRIGLYRIRNCSGRLIAKLADKSTKSSLNKKSNGVKLAI